MDIKETTSFLEPFTVVFDLIAGIMKNPKARIIRRASDMRGYYKDKEDLERLISEQDDPLHYETFECDVPEEYGQLVFCISKLQPGSVGDEFFMTKGHYHTVIETAEIYLCLRGQGYMAMKTVDGRWNAQKMKRGEMVYVPPYWAHRSVNIGNEPLISLCIYPGEAGHNYGDIADEGFPKRIFNRNSEIIIADK